MLLLFSGELSIECDSRRCRSVQKFNCYIQQQQKISIKCAYVP